MPNKGSLCIWDDNYSTAKYFSSVDISLILQFNPSLKAQSVQVYKCRINAPSQSLCIWDENYSTAKYFSSVDVSLILQINTSCNIDNSGDSWNLNGQTKLLWKVASIFKTGSTLKCRNTLAIHLLQEGRDVAKCDCRAALQNLQVCQTFLCFCVHCWKTDKTRQTVERTCKQCTCVLCMLLSPRYIRLDSSCRLHHTGVFQLKLKIRT